MPSRFQKPIPLGQREPHEGDVPGLWNVYILGLGIALLLGLVGGSLWIAWRLLAARLLG
jgi:hypothetical protein